MTEISGSSLVYRDTARQREMRPEVAAERSPATIKITIAPKDRAAMGRLIGVTFKARRPIACMTKLKANYVEALKDFEARRGK